MKQKINGILLINKPSGLTSNAVLQRAKRFLNAEKAGHTGSLDPLATGMLPICFGEATKFTQYGLEADKCYQVTGKLGVRTTTGDSEGDIVEAVTSVQISLDRLRTVLAQFSGAQKQLPPMYSALKYQGKPLYNYARQNMTIARNPRDIIIHQWDLISFNCPFFTLKIHCSKGTYIRSLIEDIGKVLTVGAHVVQLHRIYVQGFENKRMISLEEMENFDKKEEACLLPVDTLLHSLSIYELDREDIKKLYQGKSLNIANITHEFVRLYYENEFFGLGLISDNKLSAKRLCAAPAWL